MLIFFKCNKRKQFFSRGRKYFRLKASLSPQKLKFKENLVENRRLSCVLVNKKFPPDTTLQKKKNNTCSRRIPDSKQPYWCQVFRRRRKLFQSNYAIEGAFRKNVLLSNRTRLAIHHNEGCTGRFKVVCGLYDLLESKLMALGVLAVERKFCCSWNRWLNPLPETGSCGEKSRPVEDSHCKMCALTG
ncbi:hypothetical protein TNIN_115831 [Trichonephila inaurata madagascariensis]|uniref:Uncharacterized protein n=1 Tax=Trichonephila inaurata madagascariensis TaxID=2747483 RepID=A0A8X6Y026_9ARAC|nr:hypothetical protein TNIN_115831 [Trichonephila inaurata madagascariensis]